MSFSSVSAPHLEDTIVAAASASGSAPRAIIRISGPNTRAVVAKVFETSAEVKPQRLVSGHLRLMNVHSPLPAWLYFFAAPRSYTGQDSAELHTIGSPPLVEQLTADLLAAGARPARPGEFTMRAFLAGKKDLPQAEAVQAVIEAGNDSDLRAALTELAGGVSRPLAALRDDLLNLLADVEAALDFADEDIEFVGKKELLGRVEAAVAQLEEVRKQFDQRTLSGRAIRIVLVGLPNAGKSSLFNALTDGSAIVSHIPGTTRDYLSKPIMLAGTACELIDTAGWQVSSHIIEDQAQQLGREQATRADVIVWCDEHGMFADDDERRLNATGAVVLKVRTKTDLGTNLTSPLEVVVAEQARHRSAGVGHGEMSQEASLTPRTLSACNHPFKGGGQRQVAAIAASTLFPHGLESLRAALSVTVLSLARPALAPSQSRCRHHVLTCLEHLREAHLLASGNEPPELLALSLRGAIESLGEMTGAVYTNDLLDRIFSRFCIGK